MTIKHTLAHRLKVAVFKAIKRMQSHACKSKSSLAKALKVKAPETA